jgi:Tfp pilus assembly protein PilO
MPRSFELPAGLRNISWNSPQALVRMALGILLVANIVAAGFAFHWWGDSPLTLENKIEETRQQMITARRQLTQAKAMSSKIILARDQGGSFISTYMTPRRVTYSTILTELNRIAETAGVKTRENVISQEAIEGSDSLSMLTITAGYEATYPNLLKFVNLLDKSQRFLIIDSLQAQPQPGTGILQVTIKVYTFVRDDAGDRT